MFEIIPEDFMFSAEPLRRRRLRSSRASTELARLKTGDSVSVFTSRRPPAAVARVLVNVFEAVSREMAGISLLKWLSGGRDLGPLVEVDDAWITWLERSRDLPKVPDLVDSANPVAEHHFTSNRRSNAKRKAEETAEGQEKKVKTWRRVKGGVAAVSLLE